MAKHFAPLILALAAIMVVPHAYAAPGEQAAAQSRPAPTTLPALRPIEQVLDERVAELNFEAVPFEQAVRRMAEIWRVNIVVNWRDLHGIVSRDGPVSVRLYQIRLSQALPIVLQAAREANSDVGYTAEDGLITICADGGPAFAGMLRVYDVKDLIAQAVALRKLHAAAPPPAEAEALRTPPSEDEIAGEALVQLVNAALGGMARPNTAERVLYWSGRLVVVQPPDGLKRVEILLEKLRESGRSGQKAR